MPTSSSSRFLNASRISLVNFNLIWVVDASISNSTSNYAKQSNFIDMISYYSNERFTIGLNRAVVFSQTVNSYDYPYTLPHPKSFTNTPEALVNAKTELGSRTAETNVVILQATEAVRSAKNWPRDTEIRTQAKDDCHQLRVESNCILHY